MSKIDMSGINAMAEQLAKHVTINEKGEVVVASGAYKESLPSDVDYENLIRAKMHDEVFIPAMTQAVGNNMLNAYKDNPGVSEMSTSVQMAHNDMLHVNSQRNRENNNPHGGEKITTWMPTRVILSSSGADGSRGAMAKVRDSLSAAALQAFGQ